MKGTILDLTKVECGRFGAALVMIALALVTLIHALRVTSGIPLADEWRWFVDLLIPYLNGDISFFRYLTGEYSLLAHTHFPALILLYLTCTQFSCDLALFAYVGLAAMLTGGLLLGWLAHRAAQGSLTLQVCGMAILGAGYFCITNDFPWILVVFEYFYSLVAIVYLVVLDRYLRKKISLTGLLLATGGAVLLGDTIGLAAVFLAIGFLLVAGLGNRRNVAGAAAVALLCGITAALAYLALGSGVPLGGYSRWQTLTALLNNPEVFLTSLLHAFAQPLLDRVVLEWLVGAAKLRSSQLCLGGVGVVLTLAVLAAWWKQWKPSSSLLPLMLVSYGLLAWLLVLMSRYLDGGPFLMDAQRYVRNLAFIYCGAGMAVVSLVPTRLNRTIAVGFAFVAIASFFISALYQYRSVPHVQGYFSKIQNELVTDPRSEALGAVVHRCAAGYCASAVEYLQAHGMDAFLRK